MRLLKGLQMMPQRTEHRTGHVDLPEFAVVFEAAVALPDLEHDIERLARHVASLALDAVDAEELPVARQAAGADSEHVAALRQMVHEGDAAGEFGRMMVRQQMSAGGEFDLLGLHQRLRDQEVRRRIGLPWRGEMFTDPRLAVADAVGRAQHLEVPFLPCLEIALGWMGRYQKESEVH